MMTRPRGVLVTPSELSRLLASGAAVTLIDVRFALGGPPGRDSYRAGHLPGACYVDLETELAGAPGAQGRHPLPETATFAAALRRVGVRRSRTVVCYDGGDCAAAARLWWMLTDAGHPDVVVLDGGFAAWLADGLPSATGEVVPPDDGDFVPSHGHRRRLDADSAARLAGSGLLLDARATERYEGKHEPVDPVAGHIPGAVSAPTSANRGPDGRFADAASLRARFERLGVTDGVTVGTYCGSGITAAHELLALEIAGFAGAALYPGSWSEWCSDPMRPVATGGTDDRG